MLTEVDLGVNIDLIDPDTYALDPNGKYLIYNYILKKCVLFEFLFLLHVYSQVEHPVVQQFIDCYTVISYLTISRPTMCIT